MADATSREDCIARHRAYPFDIAGRLTPMQRARLLEMFAPVQAGESVLDVGCNSGYVGSFVPAGCLCHGVDVAPELVTLAAARLMSAQVAPAEALPFPAQSLDVVSLGEILEHVHDPVVALREAARVARRLVIGSTPHEASAWGPGGRRGPEGHRFHVRCFTEATLAATLGQVFDRFVIGVTSWEGQPQFYRFEASVG